MNPLLDKASVRKIMGPLTALTLMLTASISKGQNDYLSDSITTTNGGRLYYQSGQLLSINEVLKITKPFQEAHREIAKAKSNKDAVTVFGLIGGFMIGWPIGTALGGGEPNWGVAAAGVGLLVITIPIGSAYRRHSKNGVKLYNQEFRKTQSNGLGLKLKIGQETVGLALRF
ncbi:MAG: hypothetical protein RIC15_12135 [Vicingaceae bacterium]